MSASALWACSFFCGLCSRVNKSRIAAEGSSLLVIVGAFANTLPTIATLAAIVWYAVCLWECKTAVHLRKRLREPENRALAAFLILGGLGSFLGLYAITRMLP